jgi:hypothetical protein
VAAALQTIQPSNPTGCAAFVVAEPGFNCKSWPHLSAGLMLFNLVMHD